nr:hAT dimerization domain-containing protein / transposase-like protein [Tanacetum cinerariifolium]
WMMGQMDDKQGADELVFEDDDLTWVHVGRVFKAFEPAYSTRASASTSVAHV